MPTLAIPNTDQHVYHPLGGDALVTLPQLLAWLQIGRTTLYNLPDPPPRTMVGGAIRYRVSDVNAWLERQAANAR